MKERERERESMGIVNAREKGNVNSKELNEHARNVNGNSWQGVSNLGFLS